MQSILKANFKNILGDNWRGSQPSQKILTNLKQLPDECSYWTKPLWNFDVPTHKGPNYVATAGPPEIASNEIT